MLEQQIFYFEILYLVASYYFEMLQFCIYFEIKQNTISQVFIILRLMLYLASLYYFEI